MSYVSGVVLHVPGVCDSPIAIPGHGTARRVAVQNGHAASGGQHHVAVTRGTNDDAII